MKVAPVYCQPISKKCSTSNKYLSNSASFGVHPRKLLIDFLSAENIAKHKLRFFEAKSMCEFLGHKIVTKQGSHAEIRISDNRGVLPLVMPHNSEKSLGLLDKKRLILLFTNHITEAFQKH